MSAQADAKRGAETFSLAARAVGLPGPTARTFQLVSAQLEAFVEALEVLEQIAEDWDREIEGHAPLAHSEETMARARALVKP